MEINWIFYLREILSNETHIIDQYFQRGTGTRGAKVVEGEGRGAPKNV